MNQSRLLDLIASGFTTTSALTDKADALERQSTLDCIEQAKQAGLIETVILPPKRVGESGKIVWRLKREN